MNYLGISQRTLAPFLGVHSATLCLALKPVTRATAGVPPPPAAPPPAAPPRTPGELLAYAAAHGINLSIPEPAEAHTAPEATLQTPDTPQTHLILELLRHRSNLQR